MFLEELILQGANQLKAFCQSSEENRKIYDTFFNVGSEGIKEDDLGGFEVFKSYAESIYNRCKEANFDVDNDKNVQSLVKGTYEAVMSYYLKYMICEVKKSNELTLSVSEYCDQLLAQNFNIEQQVKK